MNPYQPPVSADETDDVDAVVEGTVPWTARERTHAVDQYLLHLLPNRLVVVSLLLIVASGGAMYAVELAMVIPTLLVALVFAAGAYLALVGNAKRRIKKRHGEFGLDVDGLITLRSQPQQFTLAIEEKESYSWPHQQLTVYRTPRGILVCPEPYLCIFLPTGGLRGQLQVAWKHLGELIKSRSELASPPASA